MSPKGIDELSSVPLFAEMDKELLKKLAHSAATKRYAVDEMVILQGDPCDGVYIVQEGWLKEIITSSSGREQTIRLLRAGDVFNEIGLLAKCRNPVTVLSLEDSILWVIERETMLRLMEEHPLLCRVITRTLAERVIQLMKLIEDLSLRTVKSRMARLLLENAVEGVISRRRWMTQTEMAARLGTVLDVVNRTVNSMENDGLIRVERQKILLLDFSLLEELANLDDQ